MVEPSYIQKDHKYNLKLSLLGPISSGKSSILSRYSNSFFNPNLRTTINIDIVTKLFSIDDELVRLEIWDSPGDERYTPTTKACFRRAQGFLVVFDLNDKVTFEGCQMWVDEIKAQSHPDSVVVLLGNKNDLKEKRAICHDGAEQFLQANGLFRYIETSALTGENIDFAFEVVIKEVIKRTKEGKLRFPSLEGSVKLKENSEKGAGGGGFGGCCARVTRKT